MFVGLSRLMTGLLSFLNIGKRQFIRIGTPIKSLGALENVMDKVWISR
jgi:hypothetical protein